MESRFESYPVINDNTIQLMINKKSKYIIPLTLVLLGGTFSCDKEYLEPKPLSFYSPENTLNDAQGMRGALIACLRNMRYEFYGDGAPIITEHIFSEVAVEGTTDKSGPAQ